MKVKFTEGPAALDVPEVGRVERGQEAEVSEKLGEQLLEQGWQRVGKRAPAKKRKSKRAPAKKRKSKRAPAKKPEASAEATQTPEPGPNQEGD